MRHVIIYTLLHNLWYFVLSLNFAFMANHYMAAMKLGKDIKTEEVEKENNESREERGVEKEVVSSRRENVSSGQETVRRESVSSGRETVGSQSGSRISLQSQLSMSRMSEDYFNKGAIDVLLVVVCSNMMLYHLCNFSRLVCACRYY